MKAAGYLSAAVELGGKPWHWEQLAPMLLWLWQETQAACDLELKCSDTVVGAATICRLLVYGFGEEESLICA